MTDVISTDDGTEIILGKDEDAEVKEPEKVLVIIFTNINAGAHGNPLIQKLVVQKSEWFKNPIVYGEKSSVATKLHNNGKYGALFDAWDAADRMTKKTFGFAQGTILSWEAQDYVGNS